MGVSQLWQLLRQDDVIKSFKASEGQHEQVLQNLEGKVVAVDFSRWACEALGQTQLQQVISEKDRVLSITFNRVSNNLRYGVLPVVVFDGIPPKEKEELRKRRQEARREDNDDSEIIRKPQQRVFQRYAKQVVQLLDALGVPHVQAPSEAEAICSMLNREGLVDAVDSGDADSWLFGANTLFTELQLSISQPYTSMVSICSIEGIRGWLGLKRGGEKAIQLLAIIIGGDYNLGGGYNVGKQSALDLVRYLLQNRTSDDGILEDFSMLLQRPEKQEILKHTKCTGCKTCGHVSGSSSYIQKHSKKSGCAQCETHSEELGGNGAGGCTPVQLSPGEEFVCQCPFHTFQYERKLEKILQKLRQDKFEESFNTTAKVYEEQICLAKECVQDVKNQLHLTGNRDGFKWGQKPDVYMVEKAFGNMDLIKFQHKNCFLKLIPLLFEWDVRNPQNQEGAHFRPLGINKASERSDNKGSKTKIVPWQYAMKYEYVGGDGEEAEMIQQNNMSQKFLVRMGLIRQLWPHLILQKEEKDRRIEEKKNKVSRRKQQSSYTQSNTLDNYFSKKHSTKQRESIQSVNQPEILQQEKFTDNNNNDTSEINQFKSNSVDQIIKFDVDQLPPSEQIKLRKQNSKQMDQNNQVMNPNKKTQNSKISILSEILEEEKCQVINEVGKFKNDFTEKMQEVTNYKIDELETAGVKQLSEFEIDELPFLERIKMRQILRKQAEKTELLNDSKLHDDDDDDFQNNFANQQNNSDKQQISGLGTQYKAKQLYNSGTNKSSYFDNHQSSRFCNDQLSLSDRIKAQYLKSQQIQAHEQLEFSEQHNIYQQFQPGGKLEAIENSQINDETEKTQFFQSQLQNFDKVYQFESRKTTIADRFFEESQSQQQEFVDMDNQNELKINNTYSGWLINGNEKYSEEMVGGSQRLGSISQSTNFGALNIEKSSQSFGLSLQQTQSGQNKNESRKSNGAKKKSSKMKLPKGQSKIDQFLLHSSESERESDSQQKQERKFDGNRQLYKINEECDEELYQNSLQKKLDDFCCDTQFDMQQYQQTKRTSIIGESSLDFSNKTKSQDNNDLSKNFRMSGIWCSNNIQIQNNPCQQKKVGSIFNTQTEQPQSQQPFRTSIVGDNSLDSNNQNNSNKNGENIDQAENFRMSGVWCPDNNNNNNYNYSRQMDVDNALNASPTKKLRKNRADTDEVIDLVSPF